MLKKNVKVIMILLLLLHTVTLETTDDLRFNILKFGQTENDYVLFQHSMSEFETGFTLCSWVRKLYRSGNPNWFSYAVFGEDHELGMTDRGTQTRIFGDETSVTSY